MVVVSPRCYYTLQRDERGKGVENTVQIQADHCQSLILGGIWSSVQQSFYPIRVFSFFTISTGLFTTGSILQEKNPLLGWEFDLCLYCTL
jgi:hypothetical protein